MTGLPSIDDGVEAEGLPAAGDHIQLPEPGGIGHEIDFLSPRHFNKLVDDARGRGEEVGHHADHHDGGDKVGQIGDDLCAFLQEIVLDLCYADRENDRDREAEDQGIKVQ